MNIDELITLLNHPKKKYIRIAKDLSESEADFIRRKIKEYRIAGISFEKKLTRHYPSPTLATHLIGYTSKDYKGELGIERLYDDKLSGIDGYQKRKRNPNNLSIYSDEEEMVLPQQGLNVQLSIDTTIQSIVEEELEAGLNHAKAKKGCAIVMDP